jgi:DNA-binding IclR family transcriptional regulator
MVSQSGTTTARANPSYLKVVAKTFRVIKTLSQVKSGLPLSALAREVQQPKTTVFRILFTLKQLGYVEQDPRSEIYKLTHLLDWSTGNPVRETLKSIARPYIERILSRFEETICLGMLDGGQILYIEILEGLRSIRMAATVNTYAPIHSTALGKSILAFLNPGEAEAILTRTPLAKLTGKTITSLPALRRHLSQVRKSGYAIDNEETERGARCVGAPIYNVHGEPFAAISVSGPISYVRGKPVLEIAHALKDICGRISRQMGCTPVQSALRSDPRGRANEEITSLRATPKKIAEVSGRWRQ